MNTEPLPDHMSVSIDDGTKKRGLTAEEANAQVYVRNENGNIVPDYKRHLEGRAPNHIMKFFKYEHLPKHLQGVSKEISELAHLMNNNLPDGPEKTTGLRKLLEAKDCFVRASLE